VHQLKEIARNYSLILPPSLTPDLPSSIVSQFKWLFNELRAMFLVAQRLQPERFDAKIVVLWDEYDSVIGSALLDQVQQSPSTELSPASSQLISSHLETLRGLGIAMKGMQSSTRLFFVTGISRLALSVRLAVGCLLKWRCVYFVMQCIPCFMFAELRLLNYPTAFSRLLLMASLSFTVAFAFVLQSLLSGVNQLQDITNDQNYSDLVGLTWDQIQAAFPTRLQLLADKTYEYVQRSKKAEDDLKEAFGVTDKTQTVASMSAEQRLQCLHLIMNDRCGSSKLPKVIFFQCSVTLVFVHVVHV
jgi:hypothetical protein